MSTVQLPLSVFQTAQSAFDNNNLAFPSITMDMDSIFSAATAAAGAASAANKRARTTVIQDPSSYQQHERININGGRKKRSIMPIIRSNLVRMDYTFKGLKDFSERGFYWMRQKPVASEVGAALYMPCYMLALNACNQEALSQGNSSEFVNFARPFRVFARSDGSQWESRGVDGHDESGSPSPFLEVATDDMRDVDSSFGAMGPRGYLNWTLVKLNLWGAKNKQTVFYIDICSVIDPDANPFRYAVGTWYPTEFSQHMDEMMRPLTVNPISTANNMTRSPWRVLKRIKVSIDAISTTEGDQDPHCKTLKLFNRWGRMVDFKSSIHEPGFIANNDTFTNPVAGVKDNATSVTRFLPEDDKLLFLVIRSTCYSKTAVEAEESNTVNPSFDLSFRSSWTKM